ncbi:MAG: hypothetical protein HYT37_00480 [Candidatus Sungbacteria bacterium]|nr:hypothetical protein [Candidatus Sungbacteria bacterium]
MKHEVETPKEWVVLLKRFNKFLFVMPDGFAVLLKKDDAGLIKGAIITTAIRFSRFMEMFGDLVNAGDYSIENWKRRNQEKEFGIDDGVFTAWRNAGCLTD